MREGEPRRSRGSGSTSRTAWCGSTTMRPTTCGHGRSTPGVAEALRVHRQHVVPDAKGLRSGLHPALEARARRDFRLHLERASIKAERPELSRRPPAVSRFRCTTSEGRSSLSGSSDGRAESCVMARTDQRSNRMVSRYRRIATSFTEFGLGVLAALNQAIQELAPFDRVGPPTGPTRSHGMSWRHAFSRQKSCDPNGT
jgi:hypothetical protein